MLCARGDGRYLSSPGATLPFAFPASHADFHSSLARDQGRIDALLDSLTAGDRLVVSGQSPWCCAGPDLE